MLFPSGVSASFYCSFATENQQWIHASGDRGCLWIDDFVLPFHGPEVAVESHRDQFAVENCSFHMERHAQRHAVREVDAGHATSQEMRMFRQFSQLVQSGERDEQWPRWTLDTQRVLDACLRSARRDGAPETVEAP